MSKHLVFAPKPKFIIPKLRPASFSLNEEEFEIEIEIDSEIINTEETSSFKEEEDEKVSNDEGEHSQSFEEDTEYELKYNNRIFKTLRKNQKRRSKSLETRYSDE
jgi:hypothetical protein